MKQANKLRNKILPRTHRLLPYNVLNAARLQIRDKIMHQVTQGVSYAIMDEKNEV